MSQPQNEQSVNLSSLPVIAKSRIVWTKHARERAKSRKISEATVVSVLSEPRKVFPGKTAGSYKFLANKSDRRLHVIAKPNEQNQWLILSVWVRGEEDEKFWLEKIVDKLVEWIFYKIFPGRKVR